MRVPDEVVERLRERLGPHFPSRLRDDGVLHIATPFMDDSNDLIDVFVVRKDDGQYEATDFGDSLGFLRLTGVDDVDMALAQREISGNAVAFDRGQLVSHEPADRLEWAVLSVGIAAMRLTHMRDAMRDHPVVLAAQRFARARDNIERLTDKEGRYQSPEYKQAVDEVMESGNALRATAENAYSMIRYKVDGE